MDTDTMLADTMEEGTPWYVYAQWILTIVIGLLGAMAGAYAGWTIDDGSIVVVTATGGFAAASAVACLICGPFRYYWNIFTSAVTPPEAKRMELMYGGSFASFDMYVTVHRVNNVYNTEGILGFFGNRNNSYVEVKVGRFMNETFSIQMNPSKKTCVSTKGTFEECFHFNVAPTDDSIRLTLYDQDVFADDFVGQCDLNITNEVMCAGFPQHKSFKLFREGDVREGAVRASAIAGNIIVSFTPASNFACEKLQAQKHLHFSNVDAMRTKLLTASGDTKYGTWIKENKGSMPTMP